MSAPNPTIHEEACAKKKRYADDLTARAAAMESCSKYGEDVLFTYQCPVCRGWHLTKNEQRGQAAVSKTNPFLETLK